jgi:hypothetical protein
MPLISKPGRYAVTVSKAEVGESATGTPYVYLGFDTEAGEHIGAWVYFSDKAFERSLQTLEDALDFDGDFACVDQMIGRPCSIVVEEHDYQGKTALRVRWINSPSKPPVPPPPGLAEKLSAVAGKLRHKQPAKAVAQTTEDVPF